MTYARWQRPVKFTTVCRAHKNAFAVLTENQQHMCPRDYLYLLPTLAPVHSTTLFYQDCVCSQPAGKKRGHFELYLPVRLVEWHRESWQKWATGCWQAASLPLCGSSISKSTNSPRRHVSVWEQIYCREFIPVPFLSLARLLFSTSKEDNSWLLPLTLHIYERVTCIFV